MSTAHSPGPTVKQPAHPIPLPRQKVPLLIGLPVPPTPLVGREREVAEVADLLRQPHVRLVTLTGPGGVGKTRLALQVAADVAPDYHDGIGFTDLSPLTDSTLVLPTIARALGLRETGDQDSADQLEAWLAGRKFLLVLDNCERVKAAAPALATLLAACPDLTILATSRILLRVSYEHTFPVPPLPIAEATALLVGRARARDAAFTLSEANTAVVTAICSRLDGLPLAIELAAARLRHLSPSALLSRLDRRLPLLIGGASDQPARLQTMRNAVAWGYDLLPPAEQSLFRRLAVFVGGFTLDAVEAVMGNEGWDMGHGEDPPPSPIAADPSPTILDGIASLIDQSLVQPDAWATSNDDTEPRYVMLEIILEYAIEQLVAHGEEETARSAHALWCLTLAERAAVELTGPKQLQWLERLEREHANLRAALTWFSEAGQIEQALRLAGALARFWEVRGHLTEGRRWLEGLLAAADNEDLVSLRAAAFGWAGRLALIQEDRARAATCLEQSLTQYRTVGDQRGIASALVNVGYLAWDQGDSRRAEDLLAQGLALCRELGDDHATAFALDNLGVIATDHDDDKRAMALFEECLALSRKTGDSWQIAVTLVNLGMVALHRGEPERATQFLTESLPMSRIIGNRRLTAYALSHLGLIAQERGNGTDAAALFVEGLVLCRDLGGQLPTPRFLEGLARAACSLGRFERAARLFGAAEKIRTGPNSTMYAAYRAIYDRSVAEVRDGMDDIAFAAAWNAGRALPLDEAIAEALAIADETPAGDPTHLRPEVPVVGLTPRELDVLRLLATGRTNPEIAEALFIGPGTVRTHVSNILAKLGAKTRTEAADLARDHGLV